MNTMVAHKIAAIPENTEMESRILDEKALNEVFVGEIDSTAPSYFEISVNGGKPQKIKCSGLLVSTGTGSTGELNSYVAIWPISVKAPKCFLTSNRHRSAVVISGSFPVKIIFLKNWDTRIPTVKLKIPRKSISKTRIPNFCYIQVIVFDLSYLLRVNSGIFQGHEKSRVSPLI